MVETELLIGTANRGKVLEISEALQGLPVALRTLDEFPILTVPDEHGATYEENANLKAESYFHQTGLLTLADDSGLEVEALNGRPGVFSARYGAPEATDEGRVTQLLAELSGLDNRRARFVCAMVLRGSIRKVTHGVVQGHLARKPIGTRGFGYDPIFIPDGYEQTFGVLPAELKDRISHRGKALAQMREFLSQLLSWESGLR